jgi:hypothetical protein
MPMLRDSLACLTGAVLPDACGRAALAEHMPSTRRFGRRGRVR